MLIMYVVGDSPSLEAVSRFLGQWAFTNKPPIYYHNDGYFVIKFIDVDERDAVIRSGPHMMGKKPVITKPWSPKFSFSEEILKQFHYG